MHQSRLISYWLMSGFLWFIAGIAVSASNKIFQQGLIWLFWLPIVVTIWSGREHFKELFNCARPLLGFLALFVFWAALSITWQVDDDPVRQLKRIMYVLLFLSGIVLVCALGRERLVRLMQVSGFVLAASCLFAIIYQYGIQGHPWAQRMEGTGLLEHPIIGGYVIGLALIWWFRMPPSNPWLRWCWILGIAVMLMFIMLTQSRGLWVALIGAVLASVLMKGGRSAWALTMLLLVCAAVGYWQFEPYITARGTSFRPEILRASLDMIAQRPLLGLGLGSDYEVRVGEHLFPHSHNLFVHVALELGIPGLLLWLGVWASSVRAAWAQVDTVLGSCVMNMLVFSTIALMFDGGNLWNTPRPEWFLTWLPVAIALGLSTYSRAVFSAETNMPGARAIRY